MKEKACCFTGHRKIPDNQLHKIIKKTEETVEKLIKQGYSYFYAGGALGYDSIAEKIVLDFKKKYDDIQLILVLPCLTQAARWSDEDKEVYEYIKAQADKVIYTSQGYTKYCMLKRNRYLVDNSSVCVCYLTQNSGGTFYTVGYVSKNGLTVYNIGE